MGDQTDDSKKSSQGTQPHLERGLLLRSTQTYGVMIVVALLVSVGLNKNFFQVTQLPESFADLRFLGAVVFLGVGLNLVLHELCRLGIPGQYYDYLDWVHEVIGELSLFPALYLAFLCSLGEELFFRVALQPYLGILWTSLVLAFLHVSPQNLVPVWMLISFISSITLSLVFHFTNSIYPGFFIGFICACFALLRRSRSHEGKKAKVLGTIDQE